MAKLPIINSKMATFDTRRVKPPAKIADDHYHTPEHKDWRRSVMERARWQCEFVDNGQRCHCRSPHERLFADHKIEIKDDASLALDLSNGWALCSKHHASKTLAERSRRSAASAM